ncbi:PucR family transcriptional regulator ligand-binding domain-containing protein [Sporosarcina sp. Marseille-Q4063]|uniref:PucR family transcriptional regulator n=1 Tax=Sporosarcina sp. Marseille-Q4063 TaxID=2810514 RepID=UPI001BB07F3B|nr:PucR family transcriptional regulator [Sporosarcina sp. Marseille-Q4063]QUW22553.1 PucR family transcriptional regulator ligand-binding domain-containing protein [Sporosarcina sp. Marseille-Q4063]
MHLSVKEILESRLLKTTKLKTSEGTIDGKVVEWVSVIESPVENFVRENEFVLTTGIGCHEKTEEFLSFVKDVYDSGASALAIATGRYIFEIPEEIIHFAEDRKFAIIEFPWEIRFADIVHEIMTKMNDLNQNNRKRSEDVQQHLIQKILEGKTLEHITKYVELELNQSVLICNEKGEAIAGSANPRDVLTLWNQLKKNMSIHESHHPMQSEIGKIENGDMQLLHLNIQSDTGHKGDFFILSETGSSLNEQEVTIAEQAVVAAALWFSRNSAVIKAESRMQNEFLLNLAKGERMSEEHVASHAEFFRYNLNLPYICIVGFPENLNDLINHDANLSQSRKASLERMSIYIKEGMLYAAENLQRQLLFAYENDEVIVFLETPNSVASDTVNQFLDLVERRFSHLLPGVTFSWGIGKEKDGIWNYTSSFQKAKAALEMGRSQRGIGKRIDFDETQINRLLLNLAINEEVQDITMSTVSPLVEYDEKRDMDLIQTFITYKNNNLNVSQTARELNLHRQSLLYRLRKIESLTMLSLVDPDDLFLLNFSIKVWTTGVIKK